MNYKDYKNFVLNYKPFDWEIPNYDFRENFKKTHSFILSFIRFFMVNKYLEKISLNDELKKPKILDVGVHILVIWFF